MKEKKLTLTYDEVVDYLNWLDVTNFFLYKMRLCKCKTIFTEMDQCVVCALKDFIREGPITAEPLCQKMTGNWNVWSNHIK